VAGQRAKRMAATKSARHSARRATRVRESRPAGAAKPGVQMAPKRAVPGHVAVPQPPALYRLCKAGWAVIVERTPNAQGTRFVCPFCPVSHRVPGPVRGFRKLRRAQWIKLRRVEE
jgi:hypothetical protein